VAALVMDLSSTVAASSSAPSAFVIRQHSSLIRSSRVIANVYGRTNGEVFTVFWVGSKAQP